MNKKTVPGLWFIVIVCCIVIAMLFFSLIITPYSYELICGKGRMISADKLLVLKLAWIVITLINGLLTFFCFKKKNRPAYSVISIALLIISITRTVYLFTLK